MLREEISKIRQKIYNLDKKRNYLEGILMRIGYLNRGSLVWRYMICSKSNCKCRRGKKYRHGPYPYLTYVKEGEVKVRYVGRKELPVVEEGTKRYVIFYKGMAKIREINKDILKLLELIRDNRVKEEEKLRKEAIKK